MLRDAARQLAGSVEADRWQALATLEKEVEDRLRSWRWKSRSLHLSAGLPIPGSPTHIILCGVTDLPPVVERALIATGAHLTALVGAPESEADAFSETGMPVAAWGEQPIPWPSREAEAIHVTADPQQQASTAMQVVADAGTEATELALGTADSEAGDAIEAAFTQAGWTAFHPASKLPSAGLQRWLRVWCQWLSEPRLATMMELLALPETACLIDSDRATVAENLSSLRDQWMLSHPDNLRHRVQQDQFRNDSQKRTTLAVLKATETLEQWRAMCLRRNFSEPVQRLLNTLQQASAEIAGEAAEIGAWLEQAQPVIERVERNSTFWIQLMLSHQATDSAQPPAGRVINVQGWLELFFEPGNHLVLCGLNEGKVPASHQGDPWLGESAKSFLGLPTAAQRAGRDGFILRAMTEARRHHGRCDLIFAKTKSNSEPMLPSRLLLAAQPEELPARVAHLFQEISPPDAKLRWHPDWKWNPPELDPPPHISATALRDYLACPFRFYLKHAAHLRDREPNRVEWNARDFGNIAHQILEHWGNDPVAKDSSDAATIQSWLSERLDACVREWFGSRIPVAVRIQTESLRQRFQWLAHEQANSRQEGWEVIATEQKFELDFNGTTVRGIIDRIDHHPQRDEWRVIDYKTGKDGGVSRAHQVKVTARTQLATHLGEDGPAVYEKSEQVKTPQTMRWINLQLPLYVQAIQQQRGVLATPCYFKLGETEGDVKLDAWDDFHQEDLDAAIACADWICGQIRNRVFGPPADKVDFDDLAPLHSGHSLDEVFELPAAQA